MTHRWTIVIGIRLKKNWVQVKHALHHHREQTLTGDWHRRAEFDVPRDNLIIPYVNKKKRLPQKMFDRSIDAVMIIKKSIVA